MNRPKEIDMRGRRWAGFWAARKAKRWAGLMFRTCWLGPACCLGLAFCLGLSQGRADDRGLAEPLMARLEDRRFSERQAAFLQLCDPALDIDGWLDEQIGSDDAVHSALCRSLKPPTERQSPAFSASTSSPLPLSTRRNSA